MRHIGMQPHEGGEGDLVALQRLLCEFLFIVSSLRFPGSSARYAVPSYTPPHDARQCQCRACRGD